MMINVEVFPHEYQKPRIINLNYHHTKNHDFHIALPILRAFPPFATHFVTRTLDLTFLPLLLRESQHH